MRLALTYNLKRSAGESDAEFDSRATIDAIADTLRELGHCVLPIDVTGSIPELVERLEAVAPEHVFNLAEGTRGAFREAFYPALFEQLALPHTGSPASVLALCLDKALTKRVVAASGVRVPIGVLIRPGDPVPEWAPVPCVVKPNFEGASKGITAASVVRDRACLADTVARILARYPDGVLVEEFVEGFDVAVGWVQGLGLLAPIGYTIPHEIYDFACKHEVARLVDTHVPAQLTPEQAASLQRAAWLSFAALGIVGYGRADFRVTRGGEAVFLEMNPLPSLDPGEKDLYAAAGWMGRSPQELLAAIVGG